MMPISFADDLRDPAPPIAGPAERAAVAARTKQLVRRRRSMQSAGALGVVAAVAVSVAALTAGGSSAPPVRVASTPRTGITGVVNYAPPLIGITVTLTGTEGQGTFTTIAHNGVFEFQSVPPGDYLATYEWESEDGTAAQFGRTTVTINDGSIVIMFATPERIAM
jgi:hypothetical protein